MQYNDQQTRVLLNLKTAQRMAHVTPMIMYAQLRAR